MGYLGPLLALLPPFMCGDVWRSVPDLGMAVVGLKPGKGKQRNAPVRRVALLPERPALDSHLKPPQRIDLKRPPFPALIFRLSFVQDGSWSRDADLLFFL